MTDRDIDDVLKRAAGNSPEVEPALLGSIAQSIGASLRPVRPIASPMVLVPALLLVTVAVGAAGAAILGMHGVQARGAARMVLISPLLLALILLAAAVSVGELTPGSRHRVSPSLLLILGCLALIAVFALCFTDYSSASFVSQGLACLKAGLLHAVPAAVFSWWILHRGFAVNSAAAGVAVGTLSGLAGVVMLELHCTNLEAPHVMVWHTAVLAVSGIAGALLVLAGRALRRK